MRPLPSASDLEAGLALRLAALRRATALDARKAAAVADGLRRDLEPAALASMPKILLDAAARSGELRGFLLARELGEPALSCLNAALEESSPASRASAALRAAIASLAGELDGAELLRPSPSIMGMTYFERICLLGDPDALAAALARMGSKMGAAARDPKTEGAQPPLWLCAAAGSAECCRMLLALGADPNLESNMDPTQTPLLAAAQGGGAEAVELLLRCGADPRRTRHDGKSIMDLAPPEGAGAMLAFLEAEALRAASAGPVAPSKPAPRV